jgi:DNA-directed RNA polymerase subunit RPC12/RpoP
MRKIRKHAHEIGSILEQDIIDANLDFQDMLRLSPDEEVIVLRAMHQTFVDHGICLREETDQGTQLVLPSYFKRERPLQPEHPAAFVSYWFEGNSNEIYASLVVRLHHISAFDNDTLWKFAADFRTQAGKRIGIKMTKQQEGSAELTVYCDLNVPEDSKVLFIKYVHEHLMQRALTVERYRHYICGECGHPVKDSELARKKLEQIGRGASIRCQNCDKKVVLWDLLEQKFSSSEFRRRVQRMDDLSRARIDNERKELILIGEAYAIAGEAGQIFRQYSNSDHGIDGEIEFKDESGQASGRRVYLQLKSGQSYLRTRRRDGRTIFRIQKQRHAEYWQTQAYPVMLVVRLSEGNTQWMNVSEYLQEHRDLNVRQVVFEGEPFTALNVAKLRATVLGKAAPMPVF